MIEHIPDIELYNWPAEFRGEVWRHITQYALLNNERDNTSLFIGNVPDNYFLAGYILPKPSCDIVDKLKIEVMVDQYAIDFGKTINDSNQGFWMHGINGEWYKLEDPADSYMDYGKEMENKVEGFLKIYNVLLKYNQDFFVSKEQDDGLTFDTSLEEIFPFSKFKLDALFIKNNSEFILKHLVDKINPIYRDKLVKNIENIIVKVRAELCFEEQRVVPTNLPLDESQPCRSVKAEGGSNRQETVLTTNRPFSLLALASTLNTFQGTVSGLSQAPWLPDLQPAAVHCVPQQAPRPILRVTQDAKPTKKLRFA